MVGRNKNRTMVLLPPSLRLSLELRIQELVGVGVMLFAVLLLISCLSYSPFDASLNTVTDQQVTNLLGRFGSYSADILIQIFGFVSWLFVLTIFIVGYKVAIHKKRVISIYKVIINFLSFVLFCISIQSIYVDQISAAEPVYLKIKCGAIGFLLSRNIYAFMKIKGLVNWFMPLMVLFFSLGVIFWKRSLELYFFDIYHSYKRMFIEIQKLLYKMKISKSVPKDKLNTKPFYDLDSVAVSEDEFSEEIIPSLFEGGEVSEESLKARKVSARIANGALYNLPSVELLESIKDDNKLQNLSKEKVETLASLLLNVLSEFGISGEIIDIQPGPVVTMYEFRPSPGIKTARVISLADDIARSMSALSARIATIPGKNAIGIELPNEVRQTVYLRPILSSANYVNTTANLPLVLGKDISGKTVVADLSKMPHLLVAGTTGSGKSVSVNTMILSLLYRFTPEQCKFIMIDPKMLELSVYNDIPHLLSPVVVEPKKAVLALKWAVKEMESRYRAMSRVGVRNIEGFNKKINESRNKGDIFIKRVQTGFDHETGKPVFEDQALEYQEIPYVVVVVDEMADLMLVAGKEIETAVQRLAQMARAAGIHLIMATQRPSVDVITGTIKANFPTRISFQVTSKIDSRTILGEQGAEQLLGHGDMLFMSGGGRIQRVHGPFVSDFEVETVAKFLKTQGEPSYIEGVTDESEEFLATDETENEKDDLFQQAVDFVRKEGRISISFIQRQFQIGYNKAARLVEQMEKKGIVTPPDRTGKRELV